MISNLYWQTRWTHLYSLPLFAGPSFAGNDISVNPWKLETKNPTRILKPNSSKHQDTPDLFIFSNTLTAQGNLGTFYLNIGDSSFCFQTGRKICATTQPTTPTTTAGSATESFRRSDFGRKDAPQCCRRTFEDFGGAHKSHFGVVQRLTVPPPFLPKKSMEV